MSTPCIQHNRLLSLEERITRIEAELVTLKTSTETIANKVTVLEGEIMVIKGELGEIRVTLNNVNENTTKLVDKLLDNVIRENDNKWEIKKTLINGLITAISSGGVLYVLMEFILNK